MIYVFLARCKINICLAIYCSLSKVKIQTLLLGSMKKEDKAYIAMKKIPYDVIKKGKFKQRSYIRFLNFSN